MTTRDLKLFGQAAIVSAHGTTPVRLKRCALLLAMLAAAPDGIERVTLADRLWEEGNEAARLRRLRRLLFEARALLGKDAFAASGTRIALGAAWRAHCDFTRYIEQYHALVSQGADVRAPAAAFDIVQAAREPLLGSWEFDESTQAAQWLDFQRTAQCSRCRRMRDRIVAALMEQRLHYEALRMMLADITRDPTDEAGWEWTAAMLFDAQCPRCLSCVAVLRVREDRSADHSWLRVERGNGMGAAALSAFSGARGARVPRHPVRRALGRAVGPYARKAMHGDRNQQELTGSVPRSFTNLSMATKQIVRRLSPRGNVGTDPNGAHDEIMTRKILTDAK